MKFDEYQETLELVKKLVEHSNTGSPKELADKLNISERTVRRLIDKLKQKDNIIFCRKVNSYIVSKDQLF